MKEVYRTAVPPKLKGSWKSKNYTKKKSDETKEVMNAVGSEAWMTFTWYTLSSWYPFTATKWCPSLGPRPCYISCRQNSYFSLIHLLIRQKHVGSVGTLFLADAQDMAHWVIHSFNPRDMVFSCQRFSMHVQWFEEMVFTLAGQFVHLKNFQVSSTGFEPMTFARPVSVYKL